MTVKDVLKDVLNLLNGVKIPISELETIGMPVGRAINGIKICIEALDRDDREKAMQTEKAKQESEQQESGQQESGQQDGEKVKIHLVEDQEDNDA